MASGSTHPTRLTCQILGFSYCHPSPNWAPSSCDITPPYFSRHLQPSLGHTTHCHFTSVHVARAAKLEMSSSKQHSCVPTSRCLPHFWCLRLPPRSNTERGTLPFTCFLPAASSPLRIPSYPALLGTLHAAPQAPTARSLIPPNASESPPHGSPSP